MPVEVNTNQEVTIHQTTEEIINEVKKLPNDTEANAIASRFGLDILTVTWEDTARGFNSSVGPNISDMTIRVLEEPMPVIRQPNFADKTWEYDMNEIPIVVNNEKGLPVETVPLDKYLKEIYKYTDLPEGTNLYDPTRDSKVLVSSQACLLPVNKMTGENNSKPAPSEFYVQIFNYQSDPDEPAVLYILATSRGTSPQLPTTKGYEHQKLYFNDGGFKRALTVQRLSQHRLDQGKTDLTAPMDEEEAKANCVFVIQVPLKYKRRPVNVFPGNGAGFPASPMMYCMAAAPAPRARMSSYARSVDVEDAIVSLSTQQFGEFPKLEKKIERDNNYPVRVTIQFYKATSNGAIDVDVITKINDAMNKAKDKGDCWSSLVVDKDAWLNRVTKPHAAN